MVERCVEECGEVYEGRVKEVCKRGVQEVCKRCARGVQEVCKRGVTAVEVVCKKDKRLLCQAWQRLV